MKLACKLKSLNIKYLEEAIIVLNHKKDFQMHNFSSASVFKNGNSLSMKFLKEKI